MAKVFLQKGDLYQKYSCFTPLVKGMVVTTVVNGCNKLSRTAYTLQKNESFPKT